MVPPGACSQTYILEGGYKSLGRRKIRLRKKMYKRSKRKFQGKGEGKGVWRRRGKDKRRG